jgi:hypothetical protein
MLTVYRQSIRADLINVPDSVDSGLEATLLRLPAARPYRQLLAQSPGIARNIHTPKTPKQPVAQTAYGFTPIRHFKKRRVLDPTTAGPPSFWVRPPAPPRFPFERSAVDFFGPFTSTLNLPLLKVFAARHLRGAALRFMLRGYDEGFPTLSQSPVIRDISPQNRVLPGTPAGDAVDAQIARAQQRGRVVSAPLPIASGTCTLPLSAVQKIRVAEDLQTFKVKSRAVVDGSHGPAGTDRGAWVNPAHISFMVPITIMLMAAYILCYDITSASLFDYTSFFETIPLCTTEIPTNCYFWKGQFWWFLDNLFGCVTTPFSADMHARVLQMAQQADMDSVSRCVHFIVRRVDDSIVLHPEADAASIPAVNAAFVAVCTAVKQPLQTAKTQIAKPVAMFDGALWDLPGKRLGYPASKQINVLIHIAHALGMRLGDLVKKVPTPHRAQLRALVRAAGVQMGRPFTRKAAESLTGKLDYAVVALVHLRNRVQPIRASWIRLPSDHNKVTFSQEAVDCLHHFLALFCELQPLWFPLRNLFVRPHDVEIYSDASGKDGFGAFGPSFFFFAEHLPQEWNLHLGTLPPGVSTGWLELASLLMIVVVRHQQLPNKVVRWFTDSEVSMYAWQSGRSPIPAINSLLWAIQTRCARSSITVIAEHIYREQNEKADLLSKQQVQAFLELSPRHTVNQRLRVPHHVFKRLANMLPSERPT